LADAETASGDVTVRRGPGDRRPAWDWNRLITPRVVFLMLPLVGLTVAAYWYPLVRWEAIWRASSAWGHGYLIPVIAVLIAHYRLNERLPRRLEPCIWGLALILAGLVVRVWSLTLKYGYPGEATFLLVVGGILLLVLGWEMFKALWISVAYLGLMIPWDTKYYEGVALPLQTRAAAAAEQFLALIGYERVAPDTLQQWLQAKVGMSHWVCRSVNIIYLESGQIAVAEACSGLHLLFAFVALGVMMAYIYRRPLWERLVIMASSVPIAVFCNMIRVTLMAIASDYLFFQRHAVAGGGTTWIPGPVLALFKGDSVPARLEEFRQTVLDPNSALHQGFGFAMLGLAFVIMWAELRIIDMFFVEEHKDEGPAAPEGAPAP